MRVHDELRPLERVLDQASRPVSFFFRDDDGGWEDARLRALLELHARHDVPLDLALIPDALTPRLVRDLDRRLGERAPLGLHQHGRAHTNHEAAGRKCEFGPSRKAVDQYTDIEIGKRRLAESFGALVDPIFTPPWNRCTQVTVVSLAALGFRALSRDRSAENLDTHGLIELPVDIDWCSRADGRPSFAELGRRLARAAAEPDPVGVMLHHAVMDDASLAAADGLLALLARHPNARCVRMGELCSRTTARAAAARRGA